MGRVKLFAVLIICVVAAAFLLLLPATDPGPTGTTATVRQPVAEQAETPASPPQESVQEEEQRVVAMQMQYAELEKLRNELRRTLGKLKAQTWNLKLPPQQANRISDEMRNGYALLKSPPMLGAFHDLEEIDREIDRVRGNLERLLEIEQFVVEKLEQGRTQ